MIGMAYGDYEINSCLFPFEFAMQHFKEASQAVEWQGRCVHVILGVLEILPTGINYIIAMQVLINLR